MANVKNGDFVQLHYTGSLEDGSVFDSSDGREPLEFQVGGGGIIAGFNDAVIDMEVDGEKDVTLSPDQAYGDLRDDLKREFPKDMLGDNPESWKSELLRQKAYRLEAVKKGLGYLEGIVNIYLDHLAQALQAF